MQTMTSGAGQHNIRIKNREKENGTEINLGDSQTIGLEWGVRDAIRPEAQYSVFGGARKKISHFRGMIR